MLSRWLPFEEPLVEIEEQIEELKRLAAQENLDLSTKITRLEDHKHAVMKQVYSDLSPWQKVLMARHPKRPYTLDYLGVLCSQFFEMHGDRAYADDGAIVAGLGRLATKFGGQAITIVGNQKGRDTKERQERNFGQPAPEGFRKGERAMQLGARFGRPIISFIDTPGAACTPEAEERGISEAIAHSQWLMSQLPVPIVVIIIGEGCSGGAIATALGDRVLMLEHSYYSVISPEGCASILYRDSSEEFRIRATNDLKITAQDALRLGVIEEIIPEPLGGAHRNLGATAQLIGEAIARHLEELNQLSPEELLEQRYQRFRKLGEYEGGAPQDNSAKDEIATAHAVQQGQLPPDMNVRELSEQEAQLNGNAHLNGAAKSDAVAEEAAGEDV